MDGNDRDLSEPGIIVRPSLHAGFLEELLGYAGEQGLVAGDIDDDGAEASVTVAAAPVARYRLHCWQVPGSTTLTELGLAGHAFERAGCWPVTGEPPAAARTRGSAADCAARAVAALRIGEAGAAARLLTEALQHLAGNPA